ncbi:hypothetical protein D042_3244 [Vibrio parahaemolyticus NIHCB0757]|nr:hypothetical protein D042_3244 [Vibrio parahaemolyticus NIHCB0757]
MNKSPKLSAIFIHDADSILPDSNSKTRRECVIWFVLKTNIETLHNNNKLLFVQLSKLLKTVSSQEVHFLDLSDVEVINDQHTSY